MNDAQKPRKKDKRKGPVLMRRDQVDGSTTDQRLLDSRGPTDWVHTDPWRVLRIQAEFVEGAEAAGQDHEALCVLHEHHFPDEEVPEVQADVDVLVQPLLEGELDAEADGDALGLAGALVRRLHGARPTAGDDGPAGLHEHAAELYARLVLRRARLGPGRAEHADGGRQFGQGAEALDELRLDAQNAPGVGVHPVRRGPLVQQPLIRRARLHLIPPAQHRAQPLLLRWPLLALRVASSHVHSLRVRISPAPAEAGAGEGRSAPG